jgi:Transposase
LAAVELSLSNSKLEGLNSKIRLINHRGYGHRSAAAPAVSYSNPRRLVRGSSGETLLSALASACRSSRDRGCSRPSHVDMEMQAMAAARVSALLTGAD